MTFEQARAAGVDGTNPSELMQNGVMTDATEPIEVPHIEPTGVADRLSEFVLVDVREQDEWDAGHSPDAIHRPLSDMTEHGIRDIDFTKPVACICRSGARSYQVATALVQSGVEAYNVTGGMKGWAAEGYEVVNVDGKRGTSYLTNNPHCTR